MLTPCSISCSLWRLNSSITQSVQRRYKSHGLHAFDTSAQWTNLAKNKTKPWGDEGAGGEGGWMRAAGAATQLRREA